jgi:hypothetical protein
METVTSLSVVGEFLKSKELHHSAGSWQDLLDKRIIPALRAQQITLKELNQLLAEVEEFDVMKVTTNSCHLNISVASANITGRLITL